MIPYYQDDHCTIYHGDCRDVMPTIEADVMVTDPPYGMAYRSNQRKAGRLDAVIGDQDTGTRDAIVALWGAERPALVFGRWSVDAPRGERQRLIWWKEVTPGMGDLSIPWGPAHEDIHLLGRGWSLIDGIKRQGSVIPTKGGTGGVYGDENKTGHPTPKPIGLMQHLIERCPPGVILDPFMGSGTTLRAAKDLGRKAIGIEIDERYCEVAAKRLGQEVLDFGGAA